MQVTRTWTIRLAWHIPSQHAHLVFLKRPGVVLPQARRHPLRKVQRAQDRILAQRLAERMLCIRERHCIATLELIAEYIVHSSPQAVYPLYRWCVLRVCERYYMKRQLGGKS